MASKASAPKKVGRGSASKKSAKKSKRAAQAPEVGAGEFKAKCLAIIDDVSRTGQEVVITKRGKAVAKLVSFEEATVDSFFGRLKGLVEIIGDPDDLVKPAFSLADWDSLK